jgi:hypothetical protein
MRGLRIALGILNLIACGSLALYNYVWFSERGASASNAFTWGMPLLLAAILALICGIYTLKGKSWGWAVSGLIVAGAVWIYCLILAWIVSWTMA